MMRKVWVRRPGASPTLIQVNQNSLVDDVREIILDKYSNSLGRDLDAPDVLLEISQRASEQPQQQRRTERLLGPEENICVVINSFFPSGQTIHEALVIHVSRPPTSRLMPAQIERPGLQLGQVSAEPEAGLDYFRHTPSSMQLAMPVSAGSSSDLDKHLRNHANTPRPANRPSRGMIATGAITGRVPPLPSPNERKRSRELRRQLQRNTSSRSTATIQSSTGEEHVSPQAHEASELGTMPSHCTSTRFGGGSPSAELDTCAHSSVNALRTITTPGARETAPVMSVVTDAFHLHDITTAAEQSTASARDRLPKPNLKSRRPERLARPVDPKQGGAIQSPSYHLHSIDGSVPAINVLIVEDNIISLRVLQERMRALKVRWQTASNGQIAVQKWRAGGIHLVLMDIQMPVMDGLEATKEIRRLERIHGIGAFSDLNSTRANSRSSTGNDTTEASQETSSNAEYTAKSSLAGPRESFKSPVIIVALTASSLQSDRHAALAAGCNDFLTKPVDFKWLDTKVKEWGCMQALVDYDGWQKWKESQ